MEIIGQATKNLSQEFRLIHSSVPWKEMAGMRDRLIHNYFGIDYETVWLTLKNDISVIKNWMEFIIEKEKT